MHTWSNGCLTGFLPARHCSRAIGRARALADTFCAFPFSFYWLTLYELLSPFQRFANAFYLFVGILAAIPSSFSNLAVMISPESVPVEFGDVWWRRCMLNVNNTKLCNTGFEVLVIPIQWPAPSKRASSSG